MKSNQVVEQLQHMSNTELLEVIEEATKLIKTHLASWPARTPQEQDRRLRAAALEAKELYESGTDMTVWTELDGAEVVDYEQGGSLAGESRPDHSG